jgi:putative transposase
MSNERTGIVTLVTQACDYGATQENACNIIGISSKTFQRWTRNSNKQDGRLEPNHSPKHKLTELERKRIIKVINEPEYSNLPPCQVVQRFSWRNYNKKPSESRVKLNGFVRFYRTNINAS